MSTTKMVLGVIGALILVSCGAESSIDDQGPTTLATPSTITTTTINRLGAEDISDRMGDIDKAVAAWRGSTSVEAAQIAAETAANLVVGPNGPGYGDRDNDGVVHGDSDAGVLAGLDGSPAGLATPLASNDCVARDVLGGSWVDPAVEWGAMLVAIDEWRPHNNTMPTLASHPMRIVGWATFTLASDSLEEAHEYAGHAKLHVDISVRALGC